jgi:hypothetical protein
MRIPGLYLRGKWYALPEKLTRGILFSLPGKENSPVFRIP